jgi:16S rRNA (guanine527-N7)-methyltransferase
VTDVRARPRRRAPDRSPLPTDPSALPPLEPSFAATLDHDLEALGLTLTPGQRAAIDAQAQLLLAWNAAINLTALRLPQQIAREHVIDSLTAVSLSHPLDGLVDGALLDLGSGGGYPGLPLGIVGGAARIALVDSVAKKARFLDVAGNAATAALEAHGERAPRIVALAERAETLAGNPEHRQRWDVVTARAVAALAELVEISLPLLGVGGRLIAWKREPGLDVERAEAASALRALGSDPDAVEVHAVTLEPLADHRLVVVTKTAPTPGRFPRSVAERRRSQALRPQQAP